MSATSASRPDFRLGDWLVRPSLATIERGAEAVHVTPRSMAVLVYLADARGEVRSRNEILDAVWPGMSVTPDALSQCVVELRKAFRDDPKHPAVIQTIPKLGLRLLIPVIPVATVEVEPQPQHPAPVRRRPSSKAALITGLVVVAIGSAALLWNARTPSAWQDPLVGADFTTVTDFIGSEEHATISQDGSFIAFVSDRDGAWDVFVGQTGTGDFQNLTRGRIPELRNPAVRMLDFSPTGSEVMIWSSKNRSWSIPVVGGDLRPGLQALPRSPGLGIARASSTTLRHLATRYSSPMPTRSRTANRSTSRHRASTVTFHSGRMTARRSTSCRDSCRTKWISGRFPPGAAIRSA